MSKLYFKYGSMGSSKTAQALMTRFNYIEKGKNVWLIKPGTDTRDGVTTISSRIGLSAEAFVIKEDDDIYELFEHNKADVIIADESQFFTAEQIEQLRLIVDDFAIPVFCYGLRTDFQSRLFEGSKRLFELADSIKELNTICKCGKKAIINARKDESGKVIVSGEQVVLGGNEKYEAMCHKCWREALKVDN